MLARNMERDLEVLSEATLAEVKEKWQKVFGTDAPGTMSRKLMIRALAHEPQSRALDRLKPKIHKQLMRVIAPESPLPGKSTTPPLQPGTRLLREWRGVCHCVDVTNDGFRWNNQTYPGPIRRSIVNGEAN